MQVVNLLNPSNDSMIKLPPTTIGTYSTSSSLRTFKADTVDLFKRSGNFAVPPYPKIGFDDLTVG